MSLHIEAVYVLMPMCPDVAIYLSHWNVVPGITLIQSRLYQHSGWTALYSRMVRSL